METRADEILAYPATEHGEIFAQLQKETDAVLDGYALTEIDTQTVIHKELRLPSLRDETRRQVIAILGFPGVGKSTQLVDLCRHLRTRPLHYPRFTRGLDLDENERKRIETQRQDGELITGYRDPFLDAAFAIKNPQIVFDGFPRSEEDAVALLERIRQTGSDLTVLYQSFPRGQEVALSFMRQMHRHRERNEGEPPEAEMIRYIKKIERTIRHDLSALMTLKRGGARVVSLDVADHSPAQVSAGVHDALALDVSDLPWLDTSLGQIEECLASEGINMAIASCGLFYRPFFNDRFGPPSLPIDLHAGVGSKKDGKTLANAFRSKFPGVRFKARHLQQLFHKTLKMDPSTGLVESQLTGPFVWMQGGVLLQNGTRTLVTSRQCLADLRAGVLRVDEEFLATQYADDREQLIRMACYRATKLLEAYPALQLEGILFEKIGEIPKKFIHRSDTLQALSKKTELLHGGKSLWKVGILPEETVKAEAVRQILLNLPKKSNPIPIPPEARLPGAMGDLQDRKLHYKDASDSANHSAPETHTEMLAVPEGYDSWFAFMASEATDEQWREWMINQTKSKKPFCGSDPFIRKVMTLDFSNEIRETLNRNVANDDGRQKLTHQGVPLQRHMIWSAICLETAATCAILRTKNVDEKRIRDVRAAMRVGMLVHDIGKLLDDSSIETPGVHQALGAKVWQKIRPQWMEDTASDIAQWCIEHHDLPGRLARGLVEKKGDATDAGATPSYKGAYDPSACREAIAALDMLPASARMSLCRDVWKADVGSVPSLRYLLPAAESLMALIDCDPEKSAQ